jgi:hypothetical protein
MRTGTTSSSTSAATKSKGRRCSSNNPSNSLRHTNGRSENYSGEVRPSFSLSYNTIPPLWLPRTIRLDFPLRSHLPHSISHVSLASPFPFSQRRSSSQHWQPTDDWAVYIHMRGGMTPDCMLHSCANVVALPMTAEILHEHTTFKVDRTVRATTQR